MKSKIQTVGRSVLGAVFLVGVVLPSTAFGGALHTQQIEDALAVAQGQGGENRPPWEMNLSQIGFVALPPGETSDVWAHGNFA